MKHIKIPKSPSEISMINAIIMYASFVVVLILACIETLQADKLFHLPIFMIFIVTYLFNIVMVLKYKVEVEKKLLKIIIGYIIICTLATIVFLSPVKDIWYILRTLVILGINIILALIRMMHLNWLIFEVTMMKRNGDSDGE